MKADQMKYALTGGGTVALAWVASALVRSTSFETVIGYGVVAGIVALVATSYRIRVKKLFR